METLEQYFARTDTPSAGSPVGTTMVKILAKFPSMDLEAARDKAKELLSVAARGRVYRAPRVLSESEQATQKARLKAAFPVKAAA